MPHQHPPSDLPPVASIADARGNLGFPARGRRASDDFESWVKKWGSIAGSLMAILLLTGGILTWMGYKRVTATQQVQALQQTLNEKWAADNKRFDRIERGLGRVGYQSCVTQRELHPQKNLDCEALFLDSQNLTAPVDGGPF